MASNGYWWGDNTHGYWLGDISTNKLIVAPQSTGAYISWGSAGTTRGTVSTTNGLANTNTLAGFGQAAHPAAYYCKNLTTGGYNTWYMPAINELRTMLSHSRATPFATANSFSLGRYHSSTEEGNYSAGSNGSYYGESIILTGKGSRNVRAVRRSTI